MHKGAHLVTQYLDHKERKSRLCVPSFFLYMLQLAHPIFTKCTVPEGDKLMALTLIRLSFLVY